jgi:hypothetical protein
MTMNKRTQINPINAQPQCLPGRQLPSDWKASTNEHGGTFDRRPLSELWKNVSSNKPEVDSPTRNARLQPLSWNEIYGER